MILLGCMIELVLEWSQIRFHDVMEWVFQLAATNALDNVDLGETRGSEDRISAAPIDDQVTPKATSNVNEGNQEEMNIGDKEVNFTARERRRC